MGVFLENKKEFVDLIVALKDAENEAELILQTAREKREKRIRDLKQEAADILAESKKEAEALREKSTSKARKDIQKEADEITLKAKKEADAVKKLKLSKTRAAEIAKMLLEQREV